MNAKARHRRRRRAEAAAQTKAHAYARDAAWLNAQQALRMNKAWMLGRPHWTVSRGEMLVTVEGRTYGTAQEVVVRGTVRI